MKILFLDIETAPNLAHVWGLWDENIPLDRLLESGYILCWSAKWLGDDLVYFDSIQGKSAKKMLKGIHNLLDEADAVVHYNGTRFDIPHLNREFIVNGFTPPAPYKEIDLLTTAKRKFKFPSNKLEYVSKALGVGSKLKHSGYSLWLRVMENDPEAWAEMEEYNIQDVILLEAVYNKMLPWVKFHTNYSLFNNTGGTVCPKCGHIHLKKRGFYYTLASKFQRYQCKKCGAWAKDNVILNRNEYKTTEI
jgi:hypothetical protein